MRADIRTNEDNMTTVKIPKILLPKKDIDKSKWSVIACDQFTSQADYWEAVEEYVGASQSTLRLIYPEVYLERDDKQARIEAINANMSKYLKKGLFDEFEGFILVDRTMNDGRHRLGLMISVDLEDYEYTEKNDALIKATEKTVVDRLPPRIEIRKGACLELPHIMMLMDDRSQKIIEKLYESRDFLEKTYDFELNMNGGRVQGYKVTNCAQILEEIEGLLKEDVLVEKYGSAKPILFAVGDGNHSLATAKECWKNIKKTLTPAQRQKHPARYALCELVNIHDKSLDFEPIHRVVFGVDKDFINFMHDRLLELDGKERVKVVFEDTIYYWSVCDNPSDAIADIQSLMDEYALTHPEMVIDYIHGDEHLLKVGADGHGVAVFMPKLQKDALFDYVVRRGALPRKSFSMGHAEDKRYYLECRKIVSD